MSSPVEWSLVKPKLSVTERVTAFCTVVEAAVPDFLESRLVVWSK